MDTISKDVLFIITKQLDNKDKIALKLTCKYLYWKLICIKPVIKYSTIVLYRISNTDPNKEFSFEIKRVKSKDLENEITSWGQCIIDEWNRNLYDECCLEYKPFCYECRMEDFSGLSELKCKKHPNQKSLYLSNEVYDKIEICQCHELELVKPERQYERIIYPNESEGYSCSKMFHILDDYNSSYDYTYRFYVYENQEDDDTSYFCVAEH